MRDNPSPAPGMTAPWQAAQARAEDVPRLAALHTEALPPGWKDADFAAYCGSVNRIVLKAGDEQNLLGLAVIQFAADEAEVLTLAVSKAARRKGIGFSLMKTAIETCQRLLISSIYLEVAESNEPAKSLYTRCGFREFARRENYYQSASPAPESALIMRLDINREVSQVGVGQGDS